MICKDSGQVDLSLLFYRVAMLTIGQRNVKTVFSSSVNSSRKLVAVSASYPSRSEYNIRESFLAPSQNIAKRKDEEEERDPDETTEELEVETEDGAGKRVTYSKTKLQK